jgi:hypothetical protein
MYASDATFNLEVVKNSLMQLSACTCGSRLSSMFVLRASLDASMTRSLMAREKSLFESAAVMLAMSAGMPADLRVIAPALSCIDRIVLLSFVTYLIPRIWQGTERWDVRRCTATTESGKGLRYCREGTTMTKFQKLSEAESAELFEKSWG